MDWICWGPDKPLTSKTEISATCCLGRSDYLLRLVIWGEG